MEVRPGYKQTEVGVIPEEWDATSLGVVCSMKSGEGITAAKIDQFSEYPCYGGNGLRGYTSRYTHDGLFALIGRQGALCGNVVGVEGKFFASEHAVVVTAQSGIDIRFLTYVLGKMHLNRFSESSAQPGLSVSKVLKLQLAVPRTEHEQRAIATALSDVDALLSGLDRLIAKKRDFKQAAMQQLLTGETRLPGFHGEWEVKRVCELGDVLTGGTPRTDVSAYWGGEYPWVTPTDISTHRDMSSSERKLTKKGLDVIRLLSPKTVLVTCIASIGKNAILTATGACNQQINAVVPHSNSDAVFLYYMFEASKQYLLANSGITATRIISKTVFAELTFSVPKLDEQIAIASVLSDMDAVLAALEARRDKTRALKQAMMQELLTGRTRLV